MYSTLRWTWRKYSTTKVKQYSGLKESTVTPKCNRLYSVYSTLRWTWRKYSTTKLTDCSVCVLYLTVNLKKVQYRPSVTNCVQYLMVDLKRVQYHQNVIDCVQYPTMNLMKIHYDQSLIADCVQYLMLCFNKKINLTKVWHTYKAWY